MAGRAGGGEGARNREQGDLPAAEKFLAVDRLGALGIRLRQNGLWKAFAHADAHLGFLSLRR